MKVFVISLVLIINVIIQGFTQERSADPVWRAALNGMMMGNPVSQAESVAVILDSGNLSCYSRWGNFLWTYYAGGKLTPFISRSREGTSYIGGVNGSFIAVNRSGRELWRRRLNGAITAPPIPGWDGRIFVPAEKSLYCYTAAGYLLWFKTFDAPIIFGPIADLQGGVILGLEDGNIHHIDHFGESRVFVLEENPVLAVPVLMQDRLILIAANQNGSLHILGEEHDETSLPSLPGRPLQAVSRNGNIVFTLQNSQVLLMSYQDASIVWTGQSQNVSSSSTKTLNMIYDERGIYVVSPNGASGFTEDGRRLWIINIQGSAAMPAFSNEGLLYSGGTDWILYTYRLEERVLGIKQSLYGPVPEGTYGLGNPGPSSWDGYYFRNDETEIRRELSMIEENIFLGKTGTNEKEFTAYLMELASGAVSSIRRGTPSPIHTAYRVWALQLLAFIGSRETIPFLADIFLQDPEEAVQAAAAETIGKIGVDPEGFALSAFSRKIYSAAPQRNEQVLSAVAAAAASLCRFSGPPLSGDGIKLLTLLAHDTMPRLVRNQARRELETLH